MRRFWRRLACPSLSQPSTRGRQVEGGRAVSVWSASLLPRGVQGQRGYGHGSILAANPAGDKRIHLFGSRNYDKNKISLFPKFDVNIFSINPFLTQKVHLWWDAFLQMQPASETSLHLIVILLVFLTLLLLLLILIFILILFNRVAAADWFSEADPSRATSGQWRRGIRRSVLWHGEVRWGRLSGRQVPRFNRQRRWEDGWVVRREGRGVR